MDAITSHLERKNSFYIFNADKMVFALRDGMLKAGLKFAQLLIWVKTHAVIGRLDYAPQHELIAYGWFGTHEFVKGKDKSVLVYPKPNKSKMHPTTKPIPLIRHLILNSTRIGDVVYDAFPW
jgi:DNA modification methylase